VGKTANYGLHITENRAPQKLVNVTVPLEDAADFGAMGYYIGKTIGSAIPMIVGTKKTTAENLKSFSASIATYGGTAMFHMEKNTAEFGDFAGPEESMEFGKKELEKSYAELDDGIDPELIVIGCPHCSAEELVRVEKALRGKKVKKEVWICCARAIKQRNAELVRRIEQSGAKVIADTCNVVCPIRSIGYSTIGTNSAKSVYYSRSLNNMKVKFAKLDELLGMA
jgi:predicted aconitase